MELCVLYELVENVSFPNYPNLYFTFNIYFLNQVFDDVWDYTNAHYVKNTN